MHTNVYVDAFNLYFGSVRGTPYKWLDVRAMCQLMLPEHTINSIKYFTAKVISRPNDPTQRMRQNYYLRALRTLPNLTIIYGHFSTHAKGLPLAEDLRRGRINLVEVTKTEEKGSDVNLAAHMLNDAWLGEYEVAAMITNDSDFLTPIQIVRQQLGLKVGIISPITNPGQHASGELARNADFFKPIRKGVLRASQFAQELTDARGTFTIPRSWRQSASGPASR